MGQMINRGQEIIRISPSQPNTIEYSNDGGRNWNLRGRSQAGNFVDLVDNGNEILGQTVQGLYYSTDEGRNWNRR